jgi:tRNA pseudouridine55 synthase
MDGVLNVYKPAGITSHDVVERIRHTISQKEIGHTGTLDPLAEGVLVLCIGRATRLVPYLQNLSKVYRATLRFGVTTSTHDAEGKELTRTSAPHLAAQHVEKMIPHFIGKVEQVPPMYSAVKHEGQRLYELARQGIEVERKSRPIDIYRLELQHFEPGEYPTAQLEVECSAGTYIRTLAADMGDRLGTGAYLEHLLRLQVGHFTLEDAHCMEDLDRLEAVEKALISPGDAVCHLARWQPAPAALQRLLNGNYYQVENPLWYPGHYIAIMEDEHTLVLIARWLPPLLRPVRVIKA